MMDGRRRSLVLSLALLAALVACAPAARQQGGEAAGAEGAARSDKTLVAAIRVEPAFLAGKALQQTSLTLSATLRLFNAGLAIIDDRGLPRPYLAEELPQLNTDSWRVFPDGRMETTYRLKPNLTWHDGAPLTAEDMVFALRVYTSPDLGVASSAPQGLIEEIVPLDQRSFVLRWRRPYPKAGFLAAGDLPPLPRHLLEQPFQQNSGEAFAGLPFWTTEYVGVGPFRLDRWERGAFIEGAGFEGHALGRPRIPRIQLTFISDANTALANLLSESIQVVMDDAIYFQQAVVVRREWAPRSAGTVLVTPGLWRYTQVQLHPERSSVRALSDLRVRRSLAHGIDKQAINDSIYEGEGIISDTVIPPTVDYYAGVDGAIIKYPFDPRRSEQLMGEAGFARGGDGVFTSPTQGRFGPELKVIQNAQNEAEQAIMAATWRQIGFDIREAVLPAAQAQDGQVRATFQALFTTGGPLGENALVNQGTAGTPRPENRWNGTNRGSWSNPEYDRLVDAFNTTLDRTERTRQAMEMARIFSEELPAFAVNFNPGITAFVSALRGPQLVAPDGTVSWNVHGWELR